MGVIVLFDGFCPLCRALASILGDNLPSGWQILAFHEYITQPGAQRRVGMQAWQPDELQILAGDQLLRGEQAWEFLVKEAPQMQVYQNLAVRLGLSPPRQARLLRFFGKTLRNLCPVCPDNWISPRRGRRSSLLSKNR